MQDTIANSAGGALAPDLSIAVFDDLRLFSGSRNCLHENSETAGNRADYDWRTASQ
jgi:hypothetical protein